MALLDESRRCSVSQDYGSITENWTTLSGRAGRALHWPVACNHPGITRETTMGEGNTRWRELLWAVVEAEARLLAVQRTRSTVEPDDAPKRERLERARVELAAAEAALERWRSGRILIVTC
jgi:hypothetical protein